MGLDRTSQNAWLASPRDARLSFDAAEHVYFWDGKRVPISVSGVWQAHFLHFEAEATVERYFETWALNPTSRYHALLSYLGLVVGADEASQKQAVVALWEAQGRDAAAKGTAMHAAIEAELKGQQTLDASVPEHAQFLRWRAEVAVGWTLLRSEWAIYDDAAQVAGTVDSLWCDDQGQLVIVDFKRSKPGTNQGRCHN